MGARTEGQTPALEASSHPLGSVMCSLEFVPLSPGFRQRGGDLGRTRSPLVVLPNLPGTLSVLGCEGSQQESLRPLGDAEGGGRKLPGGGGRGGGFPRSASTREGHPSLREVGTGRGGALPLEQGPW